MGCWWLVGPWCKVGLAEVEWSHLFVENVLLIRVTEGLRKGCVSTEAVLVGARCRRCGLSLGHSRNLAAPGFVRVAVGFRTCGFPLGENQNLGDAWLTSGSYLWVSRGESERLLGNHQKAIGFAIVLFTQRIKRP